MSPAAFHAQLASIMEVLANTAVAEILELVDSGYAELRLEISRGRRENELLRRKLRLMELRAARVTALRAASGAAALMHVGGRARVHVVARSEAPTGETLPSGSTNQEREPEPPSDQEVRPADNSTVIKVEVDEDEEEEKSWRRSEPEEAFRCVVEEPKETEAPPLKQEVADDSGSASSSWTIVEVRTASPPPSTNQRPEAFDRLVFNPLDAGCSSSDSGGGFGFASPSDQQPAGLLGVQRRAAERSGATRRRPDSGGGGGRGVGLRGLQAGGKFVCSFCGKTLACLKNLKTHMRVHTGEKPFVCSLCGKRFSDSSNLKRHHSVHTGEKRYGCVHCGKRFAQSGSLKVHMTVHSDCKEFRCSFCGKTFISSSHLRRHVSVHAADKRYAAAAATPP